VKYGLLVVLFTTLVAVVVVVTLQVKAVLAQPAQAVAVEVAARWVPALSALRRRRRCCSRQ
jgi:hypothetical protein